MDEKEAKKFWRDFEHLTQTNIIARTLLELGIGEQEWHELKHLFPHMPDALKVGIRNALRDHRTGFFDLSKIPSVKVGHRTQIKAAK